MTAHGYSSNLLGILTNSQCVLLNGWLVSDHIIKPHRPSFGIFSLLPIHLRAKSNLFALAKAIRVPIRIDEAISNLCRPSNAWLCIEVDLEYMLSYRIWICKEKYGSYWQTVLYDKKPNYFFYTDTLGILMNIMDQAHHHHLL